MTDIENKAWAAGFFDGEGSFHICYNHKRKDGSIYLYPQVAISQSGENANIILERFDKAVQNIGKVYGPLRVAKNQKLRRYMWEASGINKVTQVFQLLEPWLSNFKRQKAILVIDAYWKYKNERITELCNLREAALSHT